MKKLLLILLCLPFIGFGQACQYGSSTDASAICNAIRGNSFASDRSAEIALDKILDVTGMAKRFALKECSNISNCIAITYDGIRYILYDKEFMEAIARNSNSWSNLSILAHEVAHHINGHTLEASKSLYESRQLELEADEYSGFVMYKLGASLSEAQEAIRIYSTDKDDTYSTHPSRDKRLKAIANGYNKARSQVSNNVSNNSAILSYRDYSIKVNEYIEAGNNQMLVETLNLILKEYPNGKNNYVVLFNRGTMYGMIGDYENASKDYNSSIELAPFYFPAYYNLGTLYFNVGADYNNSDKDLAYKLFQESLPILEKAHTLNKSDYNTLFALQQLYNLFGEKKKYKEVERKIKSLR
tara:strand:+ start:526 stop:1593 length:1068 start_codon:yes stop_codon:yes gene_type:complete